MTFDRIIICLIAGGLFITCGFLAVMKSLEWWTFAVEGRSEWRNLTQSNALIISSREEQLNVPRNRKKVQVSEALWKGSHCLIVSPLGTDLSQGWIIKSSAKTQGLNTVDHSLVFAYALHPGRLLFSQSIGLALISSLAAIIAFRNVVLGHSRK